MSSTVRLAGFGVVLAVALGGGYGIGAAAGPLGPETSTAGPADHGAPDDHGDSDDEAHATRPASGGSEAATAELGGLSPTQDDFTLRSRSVALDPGDPFLFELTGPDRSVVTSYQEEHTKELHLVAVQRDGTGYRHVHPTRDATGLWRADLDLTPGPWRVVADTVPAGADEKVALGADVLVTGVPTPGTTPEPSDTASVDGYDVAMDGVPTAGRPTELHFEITRAGQPVVTDPYLGALGHLVVIRDDDLAYVHVHPDADALAFTATFPTDGRYRLFLDVQVDGQVRTVPFTVEVTS